MKVLLVVSLLACSLSSTVAMRINSSISSGLVIGDTFYFDDQFGELKTWGHSLAFCYTRGGGLARVTRPMELLMIKAAFPHGLYWIDGRDDPSPNRLIFDETCTLANGFSWNIPGIQAPSVSCMSMWNNGDAGMPNLYTSNCNDLALTLCSVPVTGCNAPPQN